MITRDVTARLNGETVLRETMIVREIAVHLNDIDAKCVTYVSLSNYSLHARSFLTSCLI